MAIAAVAAALAMGFMAGAGGASAQTPNATDGVGLFDPVTAHWFFRSPDGTVIRSTFGDPGDMPLVGDWDGDGQDSPGLYRRADGKVYLTNRFGSGPLGPATITYRFGNPGDVAVAGDWDGDGDDTVSLWRPSQGRFFVINRLGASGSGLGAADSSFQIQLPPDLSGDTDRHPLAADFDDDGRDEFGLHFPSRATRNFVTRDAMTTGPPDSIFTYGNPGDVGIAGDWDGNPTQTAGVFRPSEAKFYLRNTNTAGTGDASLSFGEGDWVPFSFTPQTDTDDDGVTAAVEDRAPNNGDGNFDGVPDKQQPNVASLPSATTGNVITVAAPPGVRLIGVRSVPNPSPQDAPPGVNEGIALFPDAFVEFTATGIAPGSSVNIDLWLPLFDWNGYFKFGRTPDNPANHWYPFLFDGTTGVTFAQEQGRSKLTLAFVDGARGDHDLTANGSIVDPGGPAVVPLDARDDTYTTPEDTALNVGAPGVLDNDRKPSAPATRAELVSGPANGTLVLNTDGSFTYTPNANFNGTDTFRYLARIGSSIVDDEAEVTITVSPVNDPPVANPDTYAVNADATLTVPDGPTDLLGNDTDAESDALSVSQVQAAAGNVGSATATAQGAMVTVAANGSFVYDPSTSATLTTLAGGATTDDTFTYQASDGNGGTATATATVTVTGVAGTVRVVKDAVPDDPQDFDFTGSLGAFSLDDDADPTLSNTGTFTVTPGVHTVAETVPVGWDLTSAVCSDGSPVTAIDVAPGETVTCTLTNTQRGTIEVVKATIPAGGTGFGFTGDIGMANVFSLDDGQIQTFTNVLPGSYTVTEDDPTPGFDLAGLVCVDPDGGSTANVGTRVASIDLDPGETVTCTFTNTQRGTIEVVKATIPAGGTGFGFTGDIGMANVFSLDDGQIQTFTNVLPGSYTVTEDDPTPAFDLTGLVCVDPDGGSTTNLGTRVASIDLDPGETVTCTFTNTQRGTIEVVKATTPAGGTGFGFTGDIGMANVFSLDDGQIQTFTNVVPGSYTVTEDDPTPGFDLTGLVCVDPDGGSTTNLGTRVVSIDLDPGETVTCVFTNTQRASIVVEKQTLPDGDAQMFDFAGDVAGTIGDGQTISVQVAPGTYTSTETVPAGWALTGIVCDDGNSTGDTGTATATFQAEAGESVTCVFTNTKLGTIEIVKATTPAGGTGFGFTGDIGMANVFSLDDGQTQTFTNVLPGGYTVTEDDPTPGFDLTGLVCTDPDGGSTANVGTRTVSIDLDPGETVTCTFTNTQRGSITIQKDTVGGDGTFGWTGDLGAFNQTTIGGTASTTLTDQVPGTFSVVEDDPAPAVLTNLTCDDGASATPSTTSVPARTATVELDPGESVTCVFTNSFNLPPSIDQPNPPAVNSAENQTSVTDVESSDDSDAEFAGLTYSLTDDDGAGPNGSDNGLFSVNANSGVLVFNIPPDFESPGDADTDNDYEVQVTVTDSGGLTDSLDITVTVTDVNEAPVITSDGGGATANVNAAENQTAVTDVQASDDSDSEGSGLTYSLTGGADQALFSVVGSSGVVTFNAAPDFESPGDANTDNDYEVQVTVTDSGGLTDVQDITLTVTNVNEAPVITSDGGGATANVNAAENQTGVTDVQASDDSDSEGSGLTYSLTGGADQALFSVVGSTGVVTFNAAPDFENPGDANTDNDYEVQVTVTDSGGLTDVQDLTVTVTDVDEPPVIDVSPAGALANYTEGDAAMAVHTGVTVSDLDSANLASATVEITSGFDAGNDVLACPGCPAGVTPAFAGSTLTLTGSPSSVADFQTALQSVTFFNGSTAPSGANREVTFVANDGTSNSTPQSVTFTFTPVNSPPNAEDDDYTGLPKNVVLDAGGSTAATTPEVNDPDGVLTKGTADSDPDSTFTVTMVQAANVPGGGSATATTDSGGMVEMNSDGTFNYVPQPGETDATDTFTYQVSDGVLTDTATVTITFGSDTIWFIDDDGGVGATGLSNDPFQTIGDFNGATTDLGDLIFLHTGTYTDDGIDLANDQQLIGEEAGLTSGSLSIATGTAPTLAPSADNGINLAQNNTIRGLNVGSTPASNSAFSGTNVGSLTIDNVSVSGDGGVVNVSTGGTLDVTFDSIESTSSSGSAGIDLTSVSGTFTVNNPGAGLDTNISNADAGIDIQSSSSTFSFAETSIGTNATGGDGINLDTNTGTFTFDSLSITTGNGDGLVANSSGTINIGGTSNAINATNGSALDVISTVVDNGLGGGGITFSTLASNSGGEGINLDTVTGSVTGAGGTITSTAGIAIDINGGNGDFTYSGTVDNDGGRSVEVTNKQAADVINFGGLIDDDGAGIHLDNNDTSTITFSGGMALDTGANVAFNATNGGTVQSTGTNTIGATTAIANAAVNIANTTIGASGVTFESIDVTGAASGIVLNNTGTSGGFTVTGDGTGALNGSGGTINDTTGHSIDLDNTFDFSISSMAITDPGATDVDGGGDIDAINILDLRGMNLIRGVAFSSYNSAGSDSHGIEFENNGVSLVEFRVMDSTFLNSLGGGSGIRVDPEAGTFNGHFVVDDNVFEDHSGPAVDFAVGDGSGGAGSIDIVVQDNLFDGRDDQIVGNDFVIGVQDDYTVHLAAHKNTIQESKPVASLAGVISATVGKGTTGSLSGGPTLDWRFTQNTIDEIRGRRGFNFIFEGDITDHDVTVFDNDVTDLVDGANDNSDAGCPSTGANCFGREAIEIEVEDDAGNSDIRIVDNVFGTSADPVAGNGSREAFMINVSDNSGVGDVGDVDVDLVVRNNSMVVSSISSGPAIEIDSEDQTTLHAVVHNNNITGGTTEDFDATTSDAGSTHCLDLNANVANGGGAGEFDLNETAGTFTVESLVDVTTRNTGSFAIDAGVTDHGGSCDEPDGVVLATAGVAQVASVNSAYTALGVTVLNRDGSRANVVTVTFTAPGAGASGTFPSGNTCVTDGNGVCSVPFTANGTAGAFEVTADATVGTIAAEQAKFLLRNLP